MERDSMREERVIALAGLLQAVSLVRTIALRGGADDQHIGRTIAAIWQQRADRYSELRGAAGAPAGARRVEMH